MSAEQTAGNGAALGMGWERVHRDLTSRLGFGDGVTEPMADNDTIVKWFEEQGRLANEWVEHELWRNDCCAAGHPDDEDCDDHGPTCCNRTHVAPSASTDGGVDR